MYRMKIDYDLYGNIFMIFGQIHFKTQMFLQTKLIIGKNIRQNMKLELALTSPPLSKIQLSRTTR